MSETVSLRFLAGGSLKPLAKRLRMLGIDCAYEGGTSLSTLIQKAAEEERVLLTVKPLVPTRKVRTFTLTSLHPDQQLLELAQTFPLFNAQRLFSRCLKCNTLLRPLPQKGSGGEGCPSSDPWEELWAQIPERVQHLYRQFYYCPLCHKVFWEGSHTLQMRERLKHALGDLPGDESLPS